jgi:hypothetical protein
VQYQFLMSIWLGCYLFPGKKCCFALDCCNGSIGQDLETWHGSFSVATTNMYVDGRVIVNTVYASVLPFVTFKNLPILQ